MALVRQLWELGPAALTGALPLPAGLLAAAGRRGSRDRGAGMTLKKVVTGLVLAGVAAVLVRTFPDVKRYLKIRSM